VLRPLTDEQRGVARLLASVEGFRRADSPDAVVRATAETPSPEPTANGAGTVADRILGRLSPRSTGGAR
jgi:hypothetical protein